MNLDKIEEDGVSMADQEEALEQIKKQREAEAKTKKYLEQIQAEDGRLGGVGGGDGSGQEASVGVEGASPGGGARGGREKGWTKQTR